MNEWKKEKEKKTLNKKTQL